MKNKKRIFVGLISAICLTGVASCSTLPLIPENATEKVEFKLSSTEGGSAEIVNGKKNVYHIGDEITVKANAYENYRFGGWSSNEVIVSKNITYTFKLADNTDLEAIFYIKTQLPIYTHIPTEMGDMVNLYEIVNDTDYTWLNIEDVERPHYTFNGWYLDFEYTTELNATNLETYLNSDPTPTEINIYAKLTHNTVNVTFNLYLDDNGTVSQITEGFTNPNVGPFYEGEQLALSDATMESTESYAYPFSGWFTDEAMTTAYTTIELTTNLTVYGKFTKTNITKHTVTWTIDDSIVETDTDVIYGANPEFNGGTPSKESTDQYTYTFSGWKIEGTEDTAIITLADYKVIEDVNFVAVFASSVNSYTISFVDYDDTQLKSETLEYGATPTAPSTPNHGGLTVDPRDNLSCYDDSKLYTFKGWDKEVTTVTGNVTYKATYEERALKDYKYTIKVVGEVNNGTSWSGHALELHETIFSSSTTINGETYYATYYMDEAMTTLATDEAVESGWKTSDTQTFYVSYNKVGSVSENLESINTKLGLSLTSTELPEPSKTGLKKVEILEANSNVQKAYSPSATEYVDLKVTYNSATNAQAAYKAYPQLLDSSVAFIQTSYTEENEYFIIKVSKAEESAETIVEYTFTTSKDGVEESTWQTQIKENHFSSYENNIISSFDCEKVTTGSNGNALKFSSSSTDGTLTLTLSKSIKKVEIEAYAWSNAAAKIAVNNETAQSFANKDGKTRETFTFTLNESTSSIKITATKRFIITNLKFTF